MQSDRLLPFHTCMENSCYRRKYINKDIEYGNRITKMNRQFNKIRIFNGQYLYRLAISNLVFITTNSHARHFGIVHDLPASAWDSYMPVADHPEYPSLSASVCAAHAEASRSFLGSDKTGLEPFLFVKVSKVRSNHMLYNLTYLQQYYTTNIKGVLF